VTDRSRRLYRWLVDGLHCFDFPLFERAGPLRQVLILLASATGLLFSCTSVVIGVKRLRRSLPGVTLARAGVSRVEQD
jgi:hypothetical protein